MSSLLLQEYAIPTRHVEPFLTWLQGNGIPYFLRAGVLTSKVQVGATREDLQRVQAFLGNLWIIKNNATFPKRERTLVEEELASWGIPYRVVRSPFVFEIESISDERTFDKFLHSLKEQRKMRRKSKQLKSALRAGVPKDASSLENF